jgi:hypothetical protein
MNSQQMDADTPYKHTNHQIIKSSNQKMPREKANLETRTLEKLKSEFITTVGDFDDFHRKMNGREKLLFKGWIQEMRRESTANFTR